MPAFPEKALLLRCSATDTGRNGVPNPRQRSTSDPFR
ncbi:hypothetical protein PR002_g27205 [Phytophthora rubi]|uniref:Uncharacterized protein n=1 Tax=Phytophthora rubi TaxID=129364 RepID=A0A6A3HN31_9STRA|nr:hypothetical protein PR002_g27205 [Phytophthora rubi]